MVSAVVIFVGLGSIFSLNTQSLQILRKTRQYSTASQVLLERVEMMRSQPWPQISRGQSLALLFQTAASSGRDLADAQPLEDILVSVPPTPGAPAAQTAIMEVRRVNGTASVIQDADFSAEPLLLVDVSISWRNSGKIDQRSVRTIIAHNGLTRAGICGSILGRPANTSATSP